MYAGCVAGAIQKDLYMGYINQSGFENVTIQKEKKINIPDAILDRYLNGSEKDQFKNGSTGIFSITVFAQKPGSTYIRSQNPAAEIQSNFCGSGPTTKSCC